MTVTEQDQISQYGWQYDFYHVLATEGTPLEYELAHLALGGEESDVPPLEFYDQFPSINIARGMMQLWVPIQFRLKLNRTSQEERRSFEYDLRQEMAYFEPEDLMWQKRHILHHLSITAEQAELCKASFLLTKV